MEDTLKGNNSTLAEKPITAADIHETWPGREVVSLLQHGLAEWFKINVVSALFLGGLDDRFLGSPLAGADENSLHR